MGLFSSIQDLANSAGANINKFKNNNFKEAVVSICALVAAADGTIDPSERTKVAQAIQRNEALKVFDASELGRLFTKYVDEALDEFGQIDLYSRVGKISGNREAAITANADGTFAPEEKDVVKKILGALKLTEQDLGIDLSTR
jgi:tellurite resistance protein TerB